MCVRVCACAPAFSAPQVKVDLTAQAIAKLDFSKELQFRLKALGRGGMPWTDNGDNPNSVDLLFPPPPPPRIILVT